jgi:hypothetical protein
MYGSDSTMMAQQNLKKKSKKKEETKKTRKRKGYIQNTQTTEEEGKNLEKPEGELYEKSFF